MSCCEDFPFWLDTNVLISLSLRRQMSTGATMPPGAGFDNAVMSVAARLFDFQSPPEAYRALKSAGMSGHPGDRLEYSRSQRIGRQPAD